MLIKKNKNSGIFFYMTFSTTDSSHVVVDVSNITFVKNDAAIRTTFWNDEKEIITERVILIIRDCIV